ncbi:hypothetical protein BT63DRAFT_152089 [Microthyrium microscopicum]|uniref:Uncharacterized protein n=1 Tax=Microthyrium microscopicum TaxID=703497 RepID=A0A6A6ULZ9_9PEZI|nr:hypothetical protein BT63DRAFT_152089 [Microthyrium microscopicum]
MGDNIMHSPDLSDIEQPVEVIQLATTVPNTSIADYFHRASTDAEEDAIIEQYFKKWNEDKKNSQMIDSPSESEEEDPSAEIDYFDGKHCFRNGRFTTSEPREFWKMCERRHARYLEKELAKHNAEPTDPEVIQFYASQKRRSTRLRRQLQNSAPQLPEHERIKVLKKQLDVKSLKEIRKKEEGKRLAEGRHAINKRMPGQYKGEVSELERKMAEKRREKNRNKNNKHGSWVKGGGY